MSKTGTNINHEHRWFQEVWQVLCHAVVHSLSLHCFYSNSTSSPSPHCAMVACICEVNFRNPTSESRKTHEIVSKLKVSLLRQHIAQLAAVHGTVQLQI